MALVAAVVASVALTTLGGAGPASAETTLEVDAGYAGAFVPGQEVPIRVRVTADRLVRGTLEVAVGTPENGTPVAMAVEVPGGGQKQFLMTAPAGLNQSPDVTARLRQDDRVIAAGRTTIRAAADTELVGILPGALRGRAVPGVQPLVVDAGTARFAAVGEAELEGAPGTLSPLSTLAADADELGRLSPGARAGVLRWLDAGGRLLVDSAKGQVVPGLPDAWQPGPRGRAPAGRGEVVATDGAIAANRWSGLVEPSGWGTLSARFVGDLPLPFTLARDAGLRTPELGWLVGFLVVYVVVVGPLLFLAVRRRGRPELAWVAVPLVALVFSSGSYVVGRDLRKSTQLVHASVLASGPSGSTATTYVGVFSRSGETARIGFPAGWSTGGFSDLGQTPSSSVVNMTADGPDARLPLNTGEFGMVHATGPVPHVASLDVTATSDAGGRVTGTIRNGTAFDLDAVAVLGSTSTLVGTLGAGAEAPFAVGNAGVVRMDGGGDGFGVWASNRAFLNDSEEPVDFGLWQAAMRQGGVNYLTPNTVVAAGWTRDFVPDVRVGGHSAKADGRTVVLARAAVTPAPQAPLALAARRDIVRDPFANRLNGAGGQNTGSVVRFVLPSGVDTSKLTLQSPFGSVEVWQDGAWKSAACDVPGCPANAKPGVVVNACPPGPVPCAPVAEARAFVAADLTVPAGAIRDGVIFARVLGPVSIDQGGLVLSRAT